MKKALAIFVTVCLLASLFVSCDNTTKLDELVSTRFAAAGSRSLIVSNENLIDFDDSSIKWQYKAVKVSDEAYDVGASSAWKTIPAKGSTEGKLDNTIEFSQGKWDFELRAVKVDTNGDIILDEYDNPACVVYYGNTEAPVLLVKQDRVRPISINLTAQFDDQTGYIVLSDVSVKHISNGAVAYDAPSKVIIDDADELVLGTDYSSTGTAINTMDGGYEISVGTHTVKVQKIGYNQEILAEEEKTIEVYAGLKTTISNWIVEMTQAGQFEPVTSASNGIVTKEIIESGASVAFTVKNVTPSMVNGKDTTVTVPASVLDGRTTATVSVAVKQASEVSSDNSFTVSDGKAAAAAIDLTLTASNSTGSSTVTTFTDPVTVNTVVAKGLSDVTVTYNGTTDGISEVSYNAESGELSFKTNHFSSFIVETSSVAVIGDNAYDDLDAAIIAYSDASSPIVVINDSGFSFDNLNKNIRIDVNNHTITSNCNYSTTIDNGHKVELVNGKIISNSSKFGPANAILSLEEGSSIELNNVEFEANSGSVLFPKGDTTSVKVIDSSITTEGAYCIATNANTADNYNVTITVDHSTLSSSDPVLVNVPCTLEIKNSSIINGCFHGVIVRGGNATIENSTINNVVDGEALLNYFDGKNWADGNTVNLAALTFGNKTSSSYQYPTTVVLKNTIINSLTTTNETGKYPAIYGYGNTGVGLGATLTYDETTTIRGDIILGNNAASINGASGPLPTPAP